MSNFSDRLLNICRALEQRLLPQCCALCGVTADAALCEDCRADLPRLDAGRCPRCALPVPGGEVCGACLHHPPAFDHCVAALRYAFPVDRLVTGLKYGGRLALSRVLAEELAQAVAGDPETPEMVLPMPLARSRLAERGFNQALEIARGVAGSRGLPLITAGVWRVADAPPQASLPWAERARNVRGAFACELPLAGCHVAVVDDVVTTGATLGELAKTLKKRGARRVTGWAVARTLRHGD